MNLELRPLTLADILDRTIFLYRSHFKLFAGISAVTQAPYYFILTVLQVAAAFLPETEEMFLGIALIILIILGSLLFIPLTCVTQGAVVKALSDIYLEGSVEITRKRASVMPQILGAYRFVGNRILPLLGTLILVGLILAGWLLFSLLIIPIIGLIIFFFSYLLVNQTVILEGLSGMDALRRSWSLVRGDKESTMKVVATFIVMSLLCGIIQVALAFPVAFTGGILLTFLQMSPGWIQLIANLVQYPLVVLTIPVPLIALTLAYYDIRIRREGFDLKMLAEHIRSASRGE